MKTQKTRNNTMINNDQTPDWYEKRAKRFLVKRPRRICLSYCLIFAFLSTAMLVIFWLFYRIETMENPQTDVWRYISSFPGLLFIILMGYIISFISLWKAIFPLKKCINYMKSWGEKQGIYRYICMEFLDKKHPPQKTSQLWATPHFIFLLPNHLNSRLYYLPTLTDWQQSASGYILQFSDGQKLSTAGLKTKGRNIIAETIAPYQKKSVPQGKENT